MAETALNHPSMPAEATALDACAGDPVLDADLMEGSAVAGLVIALVGVAFAAGQAINPLGKALDQRAQIPAVVGVGRRDQAG